MQELERQSYLKALGLTPWVARSPLPGAAPSAELEWPAPMPEPEPVVPELEVPDPEPRQRRPEVTRERPQAPVAAAPALRFTLHALVTPSVLLVIEQSDVDAPEPGRGEQQLLASLLRFYEASRSQSRSFSWPLPGTGESVQEARECLESFIRQLSNQSRTDRILWLVGGVLAEQVLGLERYRAEERQGVTSLAVSTLTEMLDQPLPHKANTWSAMVLHGFKP